MSADRPLQRNASDPQQVQRAARVAQRRAETFQASLRRVMATPEGRLVCWELIARAGVYRSIWDNSARIHYNSGRHDFGLELIAELVAADEDLYQVMETEARARARRDNHETDAANTPPATEERETI